MFCERVPQHSKASTRPPRTPPSPEAIHLSRHLRTDPFTKRVRHSIKTHKIFTKCAKVNCNGEITRGVDHNSQAWLTRAKNGGRDEKCPSFITILSTRFGDSRGLSLQLKWFQCFTNVRWSPKVLSFFTESPVEKKRHVLRGRFWINTLNIFKNILV